LLGGTCNFLKSRIKRRLEGVDILSIRINKLNYKLNLKIGKN